MLLPVMGGERTRQRPLPSMLLLRTMGHSRFMFAFLAMAVLWFVVLLSSHATLVKETPNIEKDKQHKAHKLVLPFMKNKNKTSLEKVVLHRPQEEDNGNNRNNAWQSSSSALTLPDAFEAVLERARQKEEYCNNGDKVVSTDEMDKSFEIPFENGTVASLPSFGIIDMLQQWKDDPPHSEGLEGDKQDELTARFNNWNCQLPPETSCQESKFTVIFMAYNPDRLQKTFTQIHKMCTASEWTTMVQEVILVWNGPRHVNETEQGQELLSFAQETTSTESMAALLRVEYPLLLGLENDLMNRYHPGVVQVKTKAILYYDDDGPFYSSSAVQGGFELWKRHSRAQIGAMSRQIDYSPRQVKEHASLLATSSSPIPLDQHFVSHCTNAKDKVEYNYKYFANYDANMVLPSGSLLHSNYLCFLWHPVLEPIRHFVRQHPVHPDDVTVSMVVSQLGGRAPRVYSRRLNRVDKSVQEINRRQLSAAFRHEVYADDVDEEDEHEVEWSLQQQQHQQQQQQIHSSLNHRRLLFNIDWDAGAGMNDKKRFWADLRTGAINAVVRYFGSINSGSIGWCEGTKYYNAKSPHHGKNRLVTMDESRWDTQRNMPIVSLFCNTCGYHL
jgi:Glycosyl transferase family 64 domain